MNAFSGIFKEAPKNSRKENRVGNTYMVQGFTQTRNGITFIENEFSAKVAYEEVLNGSDRKVLYKVEDLQQTCTGLIFQFAEYFNKITANLELRINENWEVEEILNLREIYDRWQGSKGDLTNRFKLIPNCDQLLENYEKSIINEEKLRNSIFYTGIAQLFFPRIKQLLNSDVDASKFLRKRELQGFYFGIKVPIKEQLIIKQGISSISAEIFGSLAIDDIEDKSNFLRAFRMLYGEAIELEDIIYNSKESYFLSKDLIYQTGELEQYLEVQGVHFKKDRISFKPYENER